MPAYLTDLRLELSIKLRTVGTEAGDTALTQALKDAVRAYSLLRPRRRRLNSGSGLSIVAGTDEYELPADFVRWEPETWAKATEQTVNPIQIQDHRGYGRLDFAATRGTLEDSVEESDDTSSPTYTVYDGNPPTLVIDPVPQTAATLKADYYALHELSDATCTVPQADWGLLVLDGVYHAFLDIARERSTRPVAFEAAGDGNSQRVRMADPDALQKLAEASHAEFVRQIQRPLGVLG